MNPRIILVFFFSCLALTALPAQDAQPEAPVDPGQFPGLPQAKPGDILCRCITTFLLEDGEIFYFKIDSSHHEVDLVGEGMSQPFPVSGSTTFTLYKKVPKDDGTHTYAPAIQLPLEGSGKNFLVILSRKDGKAPVKGKAVNINKASYPADNIYLFNEAPVAIGLKINTSEGVVQPFESFQYSYSGNTRDTYTSAKIVMRYKGENKIMASKRLRLVPGRRMILVCFPSRTRVALGATPLHLITYQDKP